MAQKTLVQLTDDLDDKPIAEGEGETVAFAFRGTSYEIDLSKKNVEAFEKALTKYIDAGRKFKGGSSRRGASRASETRRPGDVDPKAVRAWAEANGIEVGPRGRLKAEIVEQFRAAGN